jgi:hypothetical protein
MHFRDRAVKRDWQANSDLPVIFPKPDVLQAAAEDDAKFVVTGPASAYLCRAMKFKPHPAGFVIPAQPQSFKTALRCRVGSRNQA